VNALAKPEVGNYLNAHFASAFQKIATFKLNGNKKQGGNVASYFSTPDGRILHIIAGPVDGATLLREARWVVETWKLAQLEKQDINLGRLKMFFRKAHIERLQHDFGIDPRQVMVPTYTPSPQAVAFALDYHGKGQRSRLNNPGRIHMLLALYPMLRIEEAYRQIFERVLNEKLSSLPVVQRG
jgi:hypothetical protein